MISRSSRGHIYLMFGLVVTTEVHLAFSVARSHSNSIAEMTAMTEAWAFLGPRGPVTPDGQSCFQACCWYLSGHDPGPHSCAAGTCLSTVYDLCPAQTCALPCNMCMVHCGNLGNECADHAASLCTCGLISSHNVTFGTLSDSDGCFQWVPQYQ